MSNFLNDTFFTNDIEFISPQGITQGKEAVIAGNTFFVSSSRDIRHVNGLLQYNFISCDQVTVRETHRTIGYLPDFTTFPPQPTWFRGDDIVYLTFVRIKNEWKVNKFISQPRADADLQN